MTPVEKLQLKNSVMRALHAPGGPYAPGVPVAAAPLGTAGIMAESKAGQSAPVYGKKNILEMTMVFDCSLSRAQAKEYGAQIIGTLKSADEIFRNTRLNVIRWISDEKIRHDVTAAPILQMGGYFADYEQNICSKRLEVLMGNLKKFEARSRLVIFMTDGTYRIEDQRQLRENLNPFLYRRLVIVEPDRICDGISLLQSKQV